MHQIRTLKNLILLSLDALPATIDELNHRDFLKNIAKFNIERLVQQLEVDNKVYYRGASDKIYAKKEAVKLAEKEES